MRLWNALPNLSAAWRGRLPDTGAHWRLLLEMKEGGGRAGGLLLAVSFNPDLGTSHLFSPPPGVAWPCIFLWVIGCFFFNWFLPGSVLQRAVKRRCVFFQVVVGDCLIQRWIANPPEHLEEGAEIQDLWNGSHRDVGCLKGIFQRK